MNGHRWKGCQGQRSRSWTDQWRAYITTVWRPGLLVFKCFVCNSLQVHSSTLTFLTFTTGSHWKKDAKFGSHFLWHAVRVRLWSLNKSVTCYLQVHQRMDLKCYWLYSSHAMLYVMLMLSKAVKSAGVERRNHAKEQRCTAAGRVDYKPVLKSHQAAYNPMVN